MIRILVAEAEEAMRILLSEELEEEGYEVVAVPPEDLGKRLAAKKPSVVLLGSMALTHRQVCFLRQKGLPVLTYGQFPLKPAWASEPGPEELPDEEFDLRRIKDRIRELLGRSRRSSERPFRDAKAPPPHIPRIQMSFSFHWSGE